MTTNEKTIEQRIASAAAHRAQVIGGKLGLLPGTWIGDLTKDYERLLTLEYAEEQRTKECTNPDCRTCFEYVGRPRAAASASPQVDLCTARHVEADGTTSICFREAGHQDAHATAGGRAFGVATEVERRIAATFLRFKASCYGGEHPQNVGARIALLQTAKEIERGEDRIERGPISATRRETCDCGACAICASMRTGAELVAEQARERSTSATVEPECTNCGVHPKDAVNEPCSGGNGYLGHHFVYRSSEAPPERFEPLEALRRIATWCERRGTSHESCDEALDTIYAIACTSRSIAKRSTDYAPGEREPLLEIARCVGRMIDAHDPDVKNRPSFSSAEKYAYEAFRAWRKRSDGHG